MHRLLSYFFFFLELPDNLVPGLVDVRSESLSVGNSPGQRAKLLEKYDVALMSLEGQTMPSVSSDN